MGRKRIPAPASGDHHGRQRGGHAGKAPPGLAVVERDGYWHIHGTVRVADRPGVRVRRSTGLAATRATRPAADELRSQVEREIRDRVIFGIGPAVPAAVAMLQFLDAPREAALNHKSVAVAKAIGAQFGARPLRDIADDEWQTWFDGRYGRLSASSRARYLSALGGIMTWLEAKPRQWVMKRPEMEKVSAWKAQRHAPRRRVVDLRPDLVSFVLDHAAPHLRAILYVAWSTGARMSSLLWGCRLCDVLLAEGREQITFHDTKNGDAVTAALHPVAASELRAYLEKRPDLHDRERPVFLTDEGLPYSDRGRGQFGGQVKTAMRGMKRRAVAALLTGAEEAEAVGDVDAARTLRADADLVGRITPHWLRHWLATHMADLTTAMRQGGWRDTRSIMRYRHDLEEARRTAVAGLGLTAGGAKPASDDTQLTRRRVTARKSE